MLKVGSDCRHVRPEELGENFRRIHDGAVLNGRQATRLRLRKLPTSSCVNIIKRHDLTLVHANSRAEDTVRFWTVRSPLRSGAWSGGELVRRGQNRRHAWFSLQASNHIALAVTSPAITLHIEHVIRLSQVAFVSLHQTSVSEPVRGRIGQTARLCRELPWERRRVKRFVAAGTAALEIAVPSRSAAR